MSNIPFAGDDRFKTIYDRDMWVIAELKRGRGCEEIANEIWSSRGNIYAIRKKYQGKETSEAIKKKILSKQKALAYYEEKVLQTKKELGKLYAKKS